MMRFLINLLLVVFMMAIVVPTASAQPAGDPVGSAVTTHLKALLGELDEAQDMFVLASDLVELTSKGAELTKATELDTEAEENLAKAKSDGSPNAVVAILTKTARELDAKQIEAQDSMDEFVASLKKKHKLSDEVDDDSNTAKAELQTALGHEEESVVDTKEELDKRETTLSRTRAAFIQFAETNATLAGNGKLDAIAQKLGQGVTVKAFPQKFHDQLGSLTGSVGEVKASVDGVAQKVESVGTAVAGNTAAVDRLTAEVKLLREQLNSKLDTINTTLSTIKPPNFDVTPLVNALKAKVLKVDIPTDVLTVLNQKLDAIATAAAKPDPNVEAIAAHLKAYLEQPGVDLRYEVYRDRCGREYRKYFYTNKAGNKVYVTPKPSS
ncbi:MAG: hypothetical protein ABIA92_04790 [Patescibacteria group bacterium]